MSQSRGPIGFGIFFLRIFRVSSLAFVVLLASVVLVGVVGSDEIHPLICVMLYCLSLVGGLSRFESHGTKARSAE
jgi:hypothetical protein